MRRFLKLFVLTEPEQRVVIVVILFLVATAFYKRHRDSHAFVLPQPTANASPTPEAPARSNTPP